MSRQSFFLTVCACALVLPLSQARGASLIPDPSAALIMDLTAATLPPKGPLDPDEPLARIAGSDYADGIDEFAGPTRPDARTLSNALSQPVHAKSDPVPFSNLGVAFFQLIASHEIAHTNTNPAEPAPIPLGPDDPLYDPDNYQEIPFDRSQIEAGTGTDATNPRQQINHITKAFDASTVYGSNATTEASLRDDDQPYLLKVGPGGTLPLNAVGRPMAGDGRADENPNLQSLHALFLREHNRLATTIKDECSADGCTDDQVFDATQILVAGMQHKIFYDELVPIFLGTDDLRSLLPDPGTLDGVAPAIFQEFPAAAGRLGHTQVPDTIETAAPGGPIASVSLKECFFAQFRGSDCLAGVAEDEKLFGAAQQAAEAIDTVVVDSLRNAQIPGPTADFVIDLFATNIQRGRDHGLSDFMAVREALGFDDAGVVLADLVPQYVIDAYGPDNADGIDLLVGLFSEFRGPGDYLGATGKALWAYQLESIRNEVFAFPSPAATPVALFGATPAESQALLDEWLDGVTMAGLLSGDTGYDLAVWGASPFLADTSSTAPVPVPPALALMLGALGVLGGLRRRPARNA